VTDRIRGVVAPVLTPFTADLRPDAGRFVDHCRWLLARHAGLAMFGTTSEANSLSVGERTELLDRAIAGGCDPARMMPGTGCCSLPDTVTLTAHAVRHGCAGVLMLPPFYYKGVSDEGLFRHYSEVVQRVGDARLRIYLYHIPPMAAVGISPGLTERLLKAYPGAIAGMKDSSGDWENSRTFLEAFAATGFDFFVGSEGFLLANMRHGGAGCISATANVNPAAIHRLYLEWQQPTAEAQQAKLNVVRDAVGKNFPMIAALKQVVADSRRDSSWATVRPPLVELNAAQAAELRAGLAVIGFEMT
jgi:4-hydroxy-tetrahydrodipicolinate synthase